MQAACGLRTTRYIMVDPPRGAGVEAGFRRSATIPDCPQCVTLAHQRAIATSSSIILGSASCVIVRLLFLAGFLACSLMSIQPAGAQQVRVPVATNAPGDAGVDGDLSARARLAPSQGDAFSSQDQFKREQRQRAPGQYQGPMQPSESPLRPMDEFERFVSDLAGIGPDGKPIQIRRYGSDLRSGEPGLPGLDGRLADVDPLPLIPPDYVVQAGDSLHLVIWGAVDADIRLTVDRTGRISIPRIGSVMVAGLRQSELGDRIKRRVADTFRNFDLSVAIGDLRPIRVFVSGFVSRPGVYTIGGISTISQAVLRAGGPASSGSFRQITLRRKGQPALNFDMYDMLLFGERSADARLQPDDVVHVGPVGVQSAIIGSVNQPAIYELRPGETVRDLIRMAGGLSPVADARRLTLERLHERDTVRVTELQIAEAERQPLNQGDVLRAISVVATEGSQLPRNKRVRVEGEVRHPGTYILPPTSTLRDAVAAAGGLTTSAYLFGTEFTRESVRRGQQENYERALRDMEVELARTVAVQRSSSSDEAAGQAQRSSANSRLIERLRALQPTGRVVLELTAESLQLPEMLVEDGDRIMVPARATSVGVFGSVFSTGNYLYNERRQLGDYLRLAGGPTRGADEDSVFVIRANGTVVSSRQTSGWFSGSALGSEAALPGDTIFVPEKFDRTTFLQSAKDWTQVLYQFGLGVAAFKSLSN